MNKLSNNVAFFKLGFFILLFSVNIFAEAQEWNNDFEQPPTEVWLHVNRHKTENAVSGNYVNQCRAADEFAVGIYIPIQTNQNQNLNVQLKNTSASAMCVVEVIQNHKKIFWKSVPLADTSAQWNTLDFQILLPQSILKNSFVNVYVWNPEHHQFFVDDFKISLTPKKFTFVPTLNSVDIASENWLVIARTEYCCLCYSSKSKMLILRDKDNNPISEPLTLSTQLISTSDTINLLNNKWFLSSNQRAFGKSKLTLVCSDSISRTTLKISTDDWNFALIFQVKTRFKTDVTLLRSALALPFVDNNFTVYRRNQHIDKNLLQDEYYLENEGFSWNNDQCQLTVYHQTNLSSLQLDVKHKTAFFNTDFAADHPMIHYPLQNDSVDYFYDCSASEINSGDVIESSFEVNVGWNTNYIPRLMAVPAGFESAFIWSEHADWTDLRTQRAVNFGCETICDATQAVAGFVARDIPVTKSVFYNNPDRVMNSVVTDFESEVENICANKSYFDFLKQLRDRGFDIGLHTPEQYSSTQANLEQSANFMSENFCTKTWIDHGYNNAETHNREDLVCDGLCTSSPYFALKTWQKHGVRYLWNAYFEEQQPFVDYCFDNHLMQPFPGFGDAMPTRQFSILPQDKSFILWSTSYTLEAEADELWNYYLNNQRLQQLIDDRSIYIAHVYPSWTNTKRGFWTYDKNGTIIVKPAFDEALQRIASFRDQQKLLPITVSQFLDYRAAVQQVTYQFSPEAKLVLTNCANDTIKGFSIIAASVLSFVPEKEVKTKISDTETIYWFDFNPNEKIIITY